MDDQQAPDQDTVAVDAEPTETDKALARYDAHMKPFTDRLTGIGLVTEHQLLAFTRVHRQALAAALGPEPAQTSGESLDIAGEQARAKTQPQTEEQRVVEALAGDNPDALDEQPGDRLVEPSPVKLF